MKTPPLDTQPRRILLIRIDRIGDLLATTPAIRALRQAHPDAMIDLAASNKNASAALGNPHVDRVDVLQVNKPWTWPWFFLHTRLRRYDWAIDFNGGSKTGAMLARASGAGLRAAFDHPKTRRFFNFHIEPRPSIHMIHKLLHLADVLGAHSTDERMVFPVSPETEEAMRRDFPRQEGVTRVAVFIGNRKKVQTRWPREKFLELCERLRRLPGLDIHVVAGPGDVPLLEGFSWGENMQPFTGRSLEETASFLAGCDLFVTSSSGPMHLASAMGTPMVAILSVDTTERWRPLGEAHAIVNSGHEGVDVRMVEVDEVWEAVKQRIGELQAGKPFSAG